MSEQTSLLAERLAELKRLAKPFAEIAKLKSSSPTAGAEIERVLATLPSPELLASAMASVREEIETRRQADVASFGRTVADYVRRIRESGQDFLELDDAFRVGPLELGFDRALGRVRILFSDEEMLAPTQVESAEALEELVAKTMATLKSAALEPDDLVATFWEAYQYERVRRETNGESQIDRVPLVDLYRSFRAVLVRKELEAGAGRKLRRVDFAPWEFKYNLLRYRALGNDVPENRRLQLDHGSQKESSSKLAMTLGSLRADGPPKRYVYIGSRR